MGNEIILWTPFSSPCDRGKRWVLSFRSPPMTVGDWKDYTSLAVI